MTITVYRWQDAEGRGPYRPGFSHVWKDVGHDLRNPSFMEEFGLSVVNKRGPDEHLGCAFRSADQMRQWFSEQERELIRFYGYEFVEMHADRVLAESPRQLVIARRRPFRFGVRVLECA